jgi:hypothetical protein
MYSYHYFLPEIHPFLADQTVHEIPRGIISMIPVDMKTASPCHDGRPPSLVPLDLERSDSEMLKNALDLTLTACLSLCGKLI